MIRFLRHNEIDFKKWDACIEAAVNSLPYAYAWYLDIVCEENWDALIADDYSAVFPIPVKNRIIYKQIYHPYFVQQLGLFYMEQSQHQLLNYFIEQIPAQFRKINLQLNTENLIQSTFLKLKHKLTHHVLLNRAYDEIAAAYNANTKRNLKKAQAFGFVETKNITPAQLTEMRRKYLKDELKGVQDETDFIRLERLMEKSIAIDQGAITGIVNNTNEVIAAFFYLKGKHHIIYLNAISSPEGKEKNAMSWLIDHTLQQFAGRGKIFDFEGSMIPGIARYYKGFGAVEVTYPVLIK